MASSIKGKRGRQRRSAFVFACLASLLGLFIYLLGAKKIPFPHQWMANPKVAEELKEIQQVKYFTNLFLFGISIHLSVNFFLGVVLMLLTPEKADQAKIRKWRFWLSKGLVFVFSLVLGLLKYWHAVKPGVGGWGSILLLCLIITVINCCLLELLIQLMNQYGICNAFNLILFTEFLPYNWIASRNWKYIHLFWLFLITIFFIWIINLKWEVPVETNTLYTQDSKLLKKNKSKLGFRLSFSFMPFIYLSTFIGYIYTFVLMKREGTDWFSPTDLKNKYNISNIKKRENSVNKERSFWMQFLHLGDSATDESRQMFKWKNISSWFSKHGWKILGVIIFLIFIRWLVVWLEARKQRWKTREISKDLRNRGIYINRVPPGRSTRNLLKKIINKLVLFWSFIVLVFNVIFDNVFQLPLTFMNWFGGVNIGVDLVRQIRTKYKYTQTNR